MKTFKITDGLIVNDTFISAIYEVDSADITIMSEEQKDIFFGKLKEALHVLNGRIQIITDNAKASVSDFVDHFDYNLKQASCISPELEKQAKTYNQELAIEIQRGRTIVTKYYIVFRQNTDTKNSKRFKRSHEKLNDDIIAFTRGLRLAGIDVNQLVDDELISFLKRKLR